MVKKEIRKTKALFEFLYIQQYPNSGPFLIEMIANGMVKRVK